MEQDSNNSHSIYEKLELVTTDPYLERLFQQAREYELALNENGNVTISDKNNVINALDRAWPYEGKTMKVTGRVTFERNRSVETAIYQDVSMQSDGFIVVDDTIMHDSEVIARHYKIALNFYHFISIDDEIPSVGYALIDNVAIDYPFHSAEFSETKLRYFYPELMEELSSLLSRGYTVEETYMAMESASTWRSSEIVNDSESTDDLEHYLNINLDFDRDIPYRATLDGEYYVDTGKGLWDTVRANNEEFLLRFHSIDLIKQKRPGEESKTLAPCLTVSIFYGDKNIPAKRISLPPESLTQLSSLRREIYKS